MVHLHFVRLDDLLGLNLRCWIILGGGVVSFVCIAVECGGFASTVLNTLWSVDVNHSQFSLLTIILETTKTEYVEICFEAN